jgi:hypothetical protein
MRAVTSGAVMKEHAEGIAAARAGRDVGAKHALEQGSPVEAARQHRGGQGRGGVVVGEWRGHDAVAQAMGRREHAVIADAVGAAGWDQGGEAAAQGGAVGHPRGAAGRIGPAEAVLDAPVGAQRDPVGGDRGAQEVAREPLESGSVGGGDPGVGVEREALGERAQAAPRSGSLARGRGHGQRQGRLHGLGVGVGEGVGLLVAGEIGVAAGEDARGAPDDARGERLDDVVGRRRQRVEGDGAVGMFLPHAVGDQRVEVEVRVDERAEALHGGHRARVAERDAEVTRPATMLRVQASALSPTMRLALGTGVMGGFTTYSTFSWETMAYLQQGNWRLASFNVAATLFGCLAACFAGFAAARALVPPA